MKGDMPEGARELPQPAGLDTRELPQGERGDVDYHHFARRENAIEEIARLCHEVNRAYCEATGDMSQVPWEQAPDWQRHSAIMGVKYALGGATPEQLHESWCKLKLDEGWTYGEVKDAINKTHPCLVPYAKLPESQQVKDHLFGAVVRAMGDKL